jgi:hypothetical protein
MILSFIVSGVNLPIGTKLAENFASKVSDLNSRNAVNYQRVLNDKEGLRKDLCDLSCGYYSGDWDWDTTGVHLAIGLQSRCYESDIAKVKNIITEPLTKMLEWVTTLLKGYFDHSKLNMNTDEIFEITGTNMDSLVASVNITNEKVVELFDFLDAIMDLTEHVNGLLKIPGLDVKAQELMDLKYNEKHTYGDLYRAFNGGCS